MAKVNPINRFIRRSQEQIRIRSNARFYGIPFTRRKNFVLPERICGKKFSYVDSEEARVDLLYVFVEDIYGLRSTKASFQTILDVGANIGLFSMAAALAHTEADIYAYDPQSEVMESLIRNAKSFGFEAHQLAVGSIAGKVFLDVGSGTVNTRTKVSDEGDVPMVALQEVVAKIDKPIDLIKMDCEGAEWDLLSDPRAWKDVHRIAMEYHLFDGQKHEQAQQLVEELGFTVVEFYTETGGKFGLLRAYRQDAVAQW